VFLEHSFGMDENLELSISREDFEFCNSHLFDRCLKIVLETLNKANLKKGDIDEVVFVGGSSIIPKCKKMMSDYFQKVKTNSILLQAL